MRTLTLSTGSFDQTNTFEVAPAKANRTTTCSLYCGFDKEDDGVYWALNSGTTIKASYTEADRAERERLASQGPLVNGEVVLINGEQYRANVREFAVSDQVVFEKVS